MLRGSLPIVALMFVCSVAGTCGASEPTGRNVLLPIRAFVAAANAADRAKLVAAFDADSVIVDEFAPFRFPAPRAAAHWYDGFGADQAANGVSNAVITVRPPSFTAVTGHNAYVVVPTIYTYRIHGKPARETGSLAFTLVERGAHWRIGTMSWAKLTDSSLP